MSGDPPTVHCSERRPRSSSSNKKKESENPKKETPDYDVQADEKPMM